MGMFVLTDGSFYLKDGDSKREYLPTKNIDEAIKVTKRQANNILAKKSKINWLGKYYIKKDGDFEETVEDSVKNIECNNLSNNDSSITNLQFDDNIIQEVSNIVNTISQINMDKSVLITYKKLLQEQKNIIL